MARVLHYLDTETFAGTEQHVLTLLEALTAQGETCGLVCREGTELARRAEALTQVTVFPVPALPMRAALRRFGRCVAAWRPDLLHAHNGRTSLQCAAISGKGKPDRPRSVATQHFVDPAHTRYRGVKRLVAEGMHRWTNARLTRIVAIAEAVRASAIAREHLPPEKVVTIYNGILPPEADSERARQALTALGLPADGPLIVTTARLGEEKGHRHLLDAAPEVLREFPEARFVWLGRGPLEEALRAEVAQAGLAKAIHFAGFRTDAADFVALAALMVLPSLCEPFGLALVEAMMLGTPVLATDCGGPQEIVAPALPKAKETEAVGWLVPPADPRALATTIRDILRRPEVARQVARRGQARACARFTAQRMAAQMAALYQEALIR